MRPGGSVTAHLRTQEKLLRTGRDGWTGGEIEGSTRGPRGPKKTITRQTHEKLSLNKMAELENIESCNSLYSDIYKKKKPDVLFCF